MNDNPFESPQPSGSSDNPAPSNPFSSQDSTEKKTETPATPTEASPKTSTSRWPLITAVFVVVLAVVAGTVFFTNKQKSENAEAEQAAIAQAAQEECEAAALDQVARYFRVTFEGTPLYFTTKDVDSVEAADGKRATIDASGSFSGDLAASTEQVPYRCTFTYSATGSGKEMSVSAVNVTSMMMDGADFESLTYIDEELQAQEEEEAEAEAEAQREREEEEKRREQERREQRAEQERRAEQQQREEQARAQREQQQRQQQQQQNQPQQQQQAPAPAAPQQQAPSMEWATLGPYGGFMGCSQAQSMWPSNSTECYQGGDGNYYFNGLRQAMR